MKRNAERFLFFGLGMAGMLMIIIGFVIYVFVSTPSDLVELGDDYYYDPNDELMIYPRDGWPTKRESYSIPPYVYDDNYDYNDRYIVALQRSRWKRFELVFDYYNFGDYTLKDFYRLFHRDRDGTYYWVIDKKAPSIYGPLLQDEFTAVCDSLDVPSKMVDKMIEARKKYKT